MNIIAPIRRVEQYEPLVKSGANELYGGVWSSEWIKRYGKMIEYNRRGNFGEQANFTSFEELENMLQKCRRDGIEFFLTANSIFNSSTQSETLRDIFREYIACGGKNVIVSDYQTLDTAAKEGCKIVISSCAGIYNASSARFWYNLGAERLILPRTIDVSTIVAIRNALPESVLLEAFIMNTMCKYSDSMCRSLHNTKSGALCSFYDHSSKSYIGPDGEEIQGLEASKMQTASFFYKQLYSGNCSLGCGQCAVWDLINSGIFSFKIVGRLLNTDILTQHIKLTRNNINNAVSSSSREEYFRKMQDVTKIVDPDICRNGYRCYYRDIRRKG